MLKILLFIDSLSSGGAQRQMVGLAKLLQDRKYLVKVIYYHPIYFYRTYLDEYHISNEYVAGSENKIKRFFLLARAISQFQPNIVISYLDAPNMIACLLKAFGMRFSLIASERNTSQVLTCYERMKFFLLRWADVLVPNSFSQQRFIEVHYPQIALKTKVITNFVDTDLFVPKCGNKREKYRILVVGRISKQKNPLALLQAANCLKNEMSNFHIDWYGREDDEIFMQCKAYITNYQLGDFFSFHKPTNDIVYEYQQSDFFCLPSLYEGFPNVICEAMSCGLPVLCSDVCDNPLLVENGKNGFLFNPHDVKDIACKMYAMLTLPDKKLQEMKTNNRKLAEEKLSAVFFVESYIKIIESLE